MKLLITFFVALLSAQGYLEAKTSKEPKKERVRKEKKDVQFIYSQTPIVDIINELAARSEVNVIFPIADELNKLKVTYQHPGKITLSQAWQKLLDILELSNFTIKTIDAETVSVLKVDKKDIAMRQTWPVFIDVPLEELPETESIIRTIHYLHNISVKDQKSTLQTILVGTGANATGMLSATADLQFDEKANGIIITDKAAQIKSAMQLIKELDLGGMRDAIEIVPLYYTSASFITNVIKELLPQKTGTPDKPTQTPYFPKNTRVAGLDRNNAVVIMGSSHGIDVTKDFIVKYLDLPPETGESILHIYDLQYLNAQDFAPILDNLVKQQITGAQATGEKKQTGPQRYFKDVIITAETIQKPEVLKAAEQGFSGGFYSPPKGQPQVGGNRLIIAARKQDWLRIEKLIKDLDKPQPQVGIEVLIVDLAVNKNKLLGSQLRNKENGSNDSLGERVNFQSAQLSNVILEQTDADKTVCDGVNVTCDEGFGTKGDSLQADLLQVAKNLAGVGAQAGQMLISLGDEKGLYNVWQVLNTLGSTTVLSQPYLVTTNNKTASVAVGEDRLLDDSYNVKGVSTIINKRPVQAIISVSIQPRISLTNNVNMLIGVRIENFIQGNANNKQTRNFQTSANVGNGEVLVLGGLTRDDENFSGNEIPVLGRIPLVGWFFKRNAKTKSKNNLLVFIHPVILEPRKNANINGFTQHKFDIARTDLQDQLNLHDYKDPISRWFFHPDPHFTPGAVDTYIENTQHLNFDAHIDHTLGNNWHYDRCSCHDHSCNNCVAYQADLQKKEQLLQLVQNEENPLLAQKNAERA